MSVLFSNKFGVQFGNTFGNSLGPPPIPGVTLDAASGKYYPASAAEFTLFNAANSGVTNFPTSFTPTELWNCQDTSPNNLAGAIAALALTVAGTPAYRQSTAGMTRLSVNITATTVQAFTIGIGGGFDLSANSVTWFGDVATTGTPGGNRNVLTLSNDATGMRIDHNTANKLILTVGGGTFTSVATYTLAGFYPLVLVYNKTASTVTLYTNQEILVGTFITLVDGIKGIGAVQGNGDPTSKFTWLGAVSGATAEITTNNVRAWLQSRGWTIPW